MPHIKNRVEFLEVRDLRGLSYRIGERPHDIMGRSRTWMLVLPLTAMAAISVLQYGYGMAVAASYQISSWSAAGAFVVLALWVACQAGAAALTAVLRHRSAVGPARAMLIGAALCGVGPVTVGHTDSFALAVLGYSILCGSGAGIVYATCASTVAKWFPEKRGARVGIVTGAFGYGALPFILLFALTLESADHASIFTGVGVFVTLVVGACGLLFQDPPVGWWPPDIDPKMWAVDKQVNRSLRCNAPAVRQFAPGQAARTSVFVVMYLLMVFAAAAALLAVAYLPIIAVSHGFGLAIGAAAIGLLAAVNGGGRAFASQISDRFGRRQTLTVTMLLAGTAHLGLAYSVSNGHPVPFLLFAGLSGLAGGAFYPLLANLSADYFGERNAVRNFGLVYSAKLFGGLIGIGLPVLLLSSNRLPLAFVAAGLISLCAAFTTRLLHRPGLLSRLTY